MVTVFYKLFDNSTVRRSEPHLNPWIALSRPSGSQDLSRCSVKCLVCVEFYLASNFGSLWIQLVDPKGGQLTLKLCKDFVE